MIQSYKLDSLKYEYKKFNEKSLDFTIKRVAEIVGILFILISVLLLISLLSYSQKILILFFRKY